MNEPRTRLVAELEGLQVEANCAKDAFMDAATSTLHRMAVGIVRKYPEFYTRRVAEEAGISAAAWWRARAKALFPSMTDHFP